MNGLRRFSRQEEEAGHQDESFDVAALVAESVDLVQEVFRADSVEISLNTITEACFSKGSRDRLQQAVMNLLQNARDALLEQDSRQIEVKIVSHESDCKIIITDNGPGIPEGVQAKICDAFFTTKPLGKGTGLGLSLTSTIMQELGGRVEYVTGLDGTSFCLTLPRTDVSIASKALPEEIELTEIEQESKHENQVQGHGLTVLLVDDDELVREAILDVLVDYGCKVLEASQGQEALKVLCDNPGVQVVISDTRMPVMDGVELMANVQAIATQNSLQFYLLSGGDLDDLAPHIANPDHILSGLLAKPFGEDEILQLFSQTEEKLAA